MDNYNYGYNTEYQTTAVRKGKKAPLIIGLSAALLLGGSGAAYAAVPAVNNAVNKTFMSSESYCRKVYSKALDDAVSKMKDCSKQSGGLYSSAFSFELSDELKEKINDYFDSEICGNISFECQTGCSKNNTVFEYKGVLKADGNEAANADIIYDSDNGVLYLTLPELSSKTLKLEVSGKDDERKKIPKIDPDEYSKLMKDYVEILEKYSANDTTMLISDSTGTAAGVPYSYTELMTVIEGEQIKSLMAETADFMEKSEIIKEWYDAYTSPYQAFSDDLTFENTLDKMRNTDADQYKTITLDTLVDLNGDIRGLSISQGFDKLFSFAEAKNNDDIGIELSFDNAFSVAVNAEQNKNEYTGTLKVKMDDEESFSADFSKLQISKDGINGSFSFDIPDLLNENEEKNKAELTISANDKSQKYEINIDSIGKITFEGKKDSDNADIKIPENAESVDDVNGISEYFDKENGVDSILEKFGLSEDILYSNSMYTSYDNDMDYFMDDDDTGWSIVDDDGTISYSFGSYDGSSGWSYEDGTIEGRWVETEEGGFEWVPAA